MDRPTLASGRNYRQPQGEATVDSDMVSVYVASEIKTDEPIPSNAFLMPKMNMGSSISAVTGVMATLEFYGHWHLRNAPGLVAPGASSKLSGEFHEKGDQQE